MGEELVILKMGIKRQVRNLFAVLIVSLLLQASVAVIERSDFIYQDKFNTDSKVTFKLKQVQKWFESQRLDHFDVTNNTTWRQRYWVADDYFDPSTGPIFLYICGEGACSGMPNMRSFPGVLAQQYKGLVLVLEHRFYGESQPFGTQDWSVERLRYLSVDQALEDLAYFIKWVKQTGQESVGIHNPWITVGGSYPGAVSAWFRYKYPHLTIGALASSAVINAIDDFWRYDDQLYTSVLNSKGCAADIVAVNKYIDDILQQGGQNATDLKASFKCDFMSDLEFVGYIGDIYAILVQYGHRSDLCSMLSTQKDVMGKIGALQQWSAQSLSTDGYTAESLRNTTYDPTKASRQWTWQICTEFGWFITASEYPDRRTRSGSITIDYYRQLCSDVFGVGTYPTVSEINLRFGGLQERSTNIIFTNGGEDGWKWASLLESENRNIYVIPINCANCAHCVDLRTPKPTDPKQLKLAQKRILAIMGNWIRDAKLNKSIVA
eukprot:TRINITY_DN9685_c0_g1_i2.p1 TRINITY_DN9685_c0_g1~~TRINITY_DN9685_c0_g1_i2.p1  ORF type:complete len:522 (-),score=76.82 TRINITY_DN9685_c0_g1_i2:64-1539(-)